MLERIRKQLRDLLDQRAAQQKIMDDAVGAAEARGDDLTDAEAAAFTAARASVVELDEQRAALEAREAELVEADTARASAEAAEARYGLVEDGATASPARVGSEPRTYSEGTAREGRSFFRDLVGATARGDIAASDRLRRHAEEARVEGELPVEERAVGTGAFGGVTVPQYLLDMVAPARKNGRPFADICNGHPLPADGMTVEISRVTTETSTGVQAAEGDAVSEQDMDDTTLSVPVRTIAGQQTVSFQALARSSGADELIISDLVRDYDTKLDASILNDDGTSGTHLGVRNVSGNAAATYTDASPTAAEAWGKLMELIAAIAAGNLGASHLVMHSRRFWWFAAATTANHPFLTILGAPGNSSGSADAPLSRTAGVQGVIAGLPVVLDNNLPTNIGTDQDPIVGVVAEECHLWEEGAPSQVSVEKPSTLQVELALYGFSAFTAGRYPLATGDITGTGLTTPDYTTA